MNESKITEYANQLAGAMSAEVDQVIPSCMESYGGATFANEYTLEIIDNPGAAVQFALSHFDYESSEIVTDCLSADFSAVLEFARALYESVKEAAEIRAADRKF